MPRIIVVANRLIVSVIETDDKLHFQPSMGGLATGLGSFSEKEEQYDIMWIGWPGLSQEQITSSHLDENIIIERLKEYNCIPVFLTEENIDKYYHKFCNNTIWPLFHYFPQFAIFDRAAWNSYVKVNTQFAEIVAENYKENDLIWIQDYHLMLLPQLLRDKLPTASIGFFLHIPFPSYELFRILPWRTQILQGLLGADLLGFHTYDYMRHFLSSTRRLLGLDHEFGYITLENRTIKVDTFPMGIDYNKFAKSRNDLSIQERLRKLYLKIGERKIILSVDRLDYTKGISLRLKAFDQFLETHPEFLEKVTLILVVVPSRTKVPQYEHLKHEIDELVGHINGKHGKMGWVSIWYFYRYHSFPELAALYQLADVALVTPLRDGMNLIAKEFLATKENDKGVLILSEFAGAASELGEALLVNPNDNMSMVNALHQALTMADDEQLKRLRIMQKRLKRYNVIKWAHDYLDMLHQIKKQQQKFMTKILNETLKNDLVSQYQRAKKRLLFLDYDGTLVPFVPNPQDAAPDEELLSLLTALSNAKENEVVIISGRDPETLETWFGKLPISLVGEHGAWIRKKDGTVISSGQISTSWKKLIRPILETHVDRTPGSFIEEKKYSLVWHYRKVEPGLGEIRVRELIDTLNTFTANLDVKVLEGDKNVEIKQGMIDKGKAAMKWLTKETWDFILAVGDDKTDEDLFEVLHTKNAYTIKVGLKPTKAKYVVENHLAVRNLLKSLIKAKKET